METRAKVIGVLRFSVLTPTYYSERFETLEKTAEHLFSDERMELRFRIFENLCLPSLTRQSDDDFDCVVLTGESMPTKHLDRLKALLDPLPNIHCRPVGTEKHYQLLKRGYDTIPVDDCSHRIMFRLDDDDALDIDFIKRTKHLASGLLDLQGSETPFVIAYNRGFYVDFEGDKNQGGKNEVFDACERAPLSTGTTLVAPVGYPRNPYRYVHRALAQHYNTFSDISVPAFIRTIHGDNKSRPTQMGPTRKMKPKEISQQIRQHFGIETEMLKAL
ncbi:MAG: putative rhamnosyl transferase [Rhodobacteraceae bacterium]|nr:putative rhamnosyl transferase [Paracoccaceae bacterium]